MSSQSVRFCGRRGLVVFCPRCKDWRKWAIQSTPPGVENVDDLPPHCCRDCGHEFDEVGYAPKKRRVEVVGDGQPCAVCGVAIQPGMVAFRVEDGRFRHAEGSPACRPATPKNVVYRAPPTFEVGEPVLVAVGNVVQGFQFFGPFRDERTAVEVADVAFAGQDWSLTNLYAPENWELNAAGEWIEVRP